MSAVAVASRSDVPAPATLGAAVLAGAGLRLYGLGHQVMGGDELHPLRAALTQPLGQILTTYQAPDTYIPLAGVAKLALLAGQPLDERWLRLPSLVASLLAIVLIPRLAAPAIGRRAAVAAAWLFALAPPLVLYGRIVRAYAPLVLLAAAGALLAFAWSRAPRPRLAIAYAFCAGLALYTHPVAAPTAVAPLAWLWILALHRRLRDRASRPDSNRELAALLRLTLVVGATLAAVLLLTLRSLLDLASRRRIDPNWSGESVHGLLTFFAGSAALPTLAAFWLIAGFGLVVLVRHGRGDFAGLLAFSFVSQVAGVVVLAPVGVHEPLMFDRYTLTALPFALIAAAVGFAALAARGATFVSRFVARSAVRSHDGAAGPGWATALGVLLVAWLASGPLAEPIRWRTSFAHHNDFVTYGCPRPRLGAVPTPYQALAALPGDEPVLEAPWSSVWRFGRTLPLYGELHRRPVLVAANERLLADPHLALAAVQSLALPTLRSNGARFVIVHHNLAREEARLIDDACGEPGPNLLKQPVWSELRREAATLATALEQAFGPPRWSDADVAIWDLAAAADQQPSRRLPSGPGRKNGEAAAATRQAERAPQARPAT